MAVTEAHRRIGCGLGVGTYVKNMLVMGVSAPNLPAVIQNYIKACQGCLQYNLFFSAKTPFSRAIKESSGPNDSLDSCLNKNPLSFLIIDEMGPIFYTNPMEKDQFLTAHLLIGLELITSRVNIVPINDMSILSIVKALKFSKIIADVCSILYLMLINRMLH